MRKIDIAGVASLPPTPGSYLLLFEIDEPLTVHVGRLGPLTFSPGTWLYAGSAWGPGGVRARVARHFRGEKKLHWHIDALSLVQPPVAAYVELQSELQVDLTIRLECLTIHHPHHPIISSPQSPITNHQSPLPNNLASIPFSISLFWPLRGAWAVHPPAKESDLPP